MKILALTGSPRKGSNTDILVDKILEGAKTKSHATEKLHLYDYEILPCLDCRRCKEIEHVYNCPLKDGMQEIYLRLEAANINRFRNVRLLVRPHGQDEASYR